MDVVQSPPNLRNTGGRTLLAILKQSISSNATVNFGERITNTPKRDLRQHATHLESLSNDKGTHNKEGEGAEACSVPRILICGMRSRIQIVNFWDCVDTSGRTEPTLQCSYRRNGGVDANTRRGLLAATMWNVTTNDNDAESDNGIKTTITGGNPTR